MSALSSTRIAWISGSVILSWHITDCRTATASARRSRPLEVKTISTSRSSERRRWRRHGGGRVEEAGKEDVSERRIRGWRVSGSGSRRRDREGNGEGGVGVWLVLAGGWS